MKTRVTVLIYFQRLMERIGQQVNHGFSNDEQEASRESNRRLAYIKLLVESADCSDDMHVFRRAVTLLNNHRDDRFRSIADIESCIHLLKAVLRMLYELGSHFFLFLWGSLAHLMSNVYMDNVSQ